nr:hypothetical protein CFP56_03302 [Quercus suber]
MTRNILHPPEVCIEDRTGRQSVNEPLAAVVLDHVAQLRRPTTTNRADFWYRSETAWAKSKRIASRRRDREGKAAVLSLDRYDGAGRMIETSEGRRAEYPCRRCESSKEPCMVYIDWQTKGAACARCKRNAKGSCDAAKPHVLTAEERTEQVEQRFAVYEQGMLQLGSVLDRVMEENRALKAAGAVMEDSLESIREELSILRRVREENNVLRAANVALGNELQSVRENVFTLQDVVVEEKGKLASLMDNLQDVFCTHQRMLSRVFPSRHDMDRPSR